MIEMYPITLFDVTGLVGIYSCELVTNTDTVRWWFDALRVRLSQSMPYIPPFSQVVEICTTDGRLGFPVFGSLGSRSSTSLGYGSGLWAVDSVRSDEPKVVGEARCFSGRRAGPMLVVTDDATDLAALELGTWSRKDDDPNLKWDEVLHVRWEPTGFESRFLEAPSIEVDERIPIPGKARRGGAGYTPKRVGLGASRLKGSF